ncbi:hypothetical protein BJG92_01591 [Arthrobacter sp. SO5]|uniref:MarR family winged helix-turn-helix transcriptional regulator n=1 Tax=Arthrobacter sp. SO5 TaxID=1897055 RepID=UPI001E5A1C88|nr:MarR family transcriptional regulator [Arthrobacter sp. SO5]MCB5274064.1 hypothetical protein [Arthrobacter sp. SO5]
MSNNAEDGWAEQVERGRMSADELSWSLRSVNRAATQLDHALAAKLGLRQLDYEAMGHIMDQEGTQLGPAELGQRLRISTGSATELADRLERAGHIARTREGSDRRRVQLVARQEAVGLILGELGPLFADLDALSNEFTDGEQAVINRYLRAAGDRLRDHTRALGAPVEPAAPS